MLNPWRVKFLAEVKSDGLVVRSRLRGQRAPSSKPLSMMVQVRSDVVGQMTSCWCGAEIFLNLQDKTSMSLKKPFVGMCLSFNLVPCPSNWYSSHNGCRNRDMGQRSVCQSVHSTDSAIVIIVFEATRGLFWNGPRDFELQSDDEDDT
ncbi:hypothetical protein AVEN_252350-1 [Araneus ventricosus]|uniref:Uncharacterized protein n=1 Tax=Araneus ventricosus TaxID=182803 RepID=A0A4Y2AQN2_ARAVE|nr:hypothetical protein AVEN_252350-1 [Araneus ventricosus]